MNEEQVKMASMVNKAIIREKSLKVAQTGKKAGATAVNKDDSTNSTNSINLIKCKPAH